MSKAWQGRAHHKLHDFDVVQEEGAGVREGQGRVEAGVALLPVVVAGAGEEADPAVQAARHAMYIVVCCIGCCLRNELVRGPAQPKVQMRTAARYAKIASDQNPPRDPMHISHLHSLLCSAMI